MLSGTVIAEQVVRAGHPFSIGQAARATVQLPLASLPRTWELLALTPAGVRLRLGPGMDARVSVGDAVWTRAECDQRGTVAHGVTTVVLPLDAHGRIDLGEVRVLFQGVRLPARMPVPALPRALQSTLADRIDGRVAALAAASVALHVGLMVVAHVNDPPAAPSMARQATEQYRDETVAIIDASDPIFDSQPSPDDPEPGSKTTPTPTTPEPSPTTRPTRPGPRPTNPTVTEPDVDPSRMADLLFAPDGTGGPATGDLTAKRPGTDLAQQLQEVKDANATATIGDQTGRVRPGDGAPRPGTGQDPVIDRPTEIIDTVKDPEQGPPGRIKPISTPTPPGDPSVDSIIKKITTTYMAGLQRCYKKSLLGDGTLSGKATLTFTVSDRGAVTDHRVAGVDDKLGECIEGLMTKWTFTPVKDEDGDATDVDVKLGLQLTPH